MAPVRIEQVRPQDWERLRDIRLAALRDAPEAFGSTLERELAFTPQVWRSRTHSAVTLHALRADEPVGTISVRSAEGQPGRADVTGMWVDPSVRGQGVGGLLVDAAVELWRAGGGTSLALWVVTTNAAGLALYGSAGFVPTGREDVLPGDRDEVELVRVL